MKKYSLIIFFSLVLVISSCDKFKPDFSYIDENDIEISSYLTVNDGLVEYDYGKLFTSDYDFHKNEYNVIIVDVFLVEENITLSAMEELHSFLDLSSKVMIMFSNITSSDAALLLKPFNISYNYPEQIVIYSNFYETEYKVNVINPSISDENIFAYSVLQASINYIQKYKSSL